jgi:hypothetical protein
MSANRDMKDHLPFLIVLMLALSSCSSDRFRQQSVQSAKDRTLILGMSHKEALEIVRECGGQDITSNMAVVGPHGEWPLTGLFWNFVQYDSVLEIAAKDGTVVGIGYWTGADFEESKSHRANSRKNLKSVTFEEQSRTLKIQVLAEADPPFTVAIVPSSSSSDSGWIVVREEVPGEFYVVLTNTSPEPQAVWEWWNSWGYQTISFEFTTADNRQIVVSKRLQEFAKNFPSTFLISPGEHQVYAIRLNKEWEGISDLSKLGDRLLMRAIYQVSASPESDRYRVWTGRVESMSYKVNVVR